MKHTHAYTGASVSSVHISLVHKRIISSIDLSNDTYIWIRELFVLRFLPCQSDICITTRLGKNEEWHIPLCKKQRKWSSSHMQSALNMTPISLGNGPGNQPLVHMAVGWPQMVLYESDLLQMLFCSFGKIYGSSQNIGLIFTTQISMLCHICMQSSAQFTCNPTNQTMRDSWFSVVKKCSLPSALEGRQQSNIVTVKHHRLDDWEVFTYRIMNWFLSLGFKVIPAPSSSTRNKGSCAFAASSRPLWPWSAHFVPSRLHQSRRLPFSLPKAEIDQAV